MLFRIAGVVNDSIVDGPGVRLAIFFQGCNYKCPGCHNVNTWDVNAGHLEDTNTITKMIKENPLLDGITLTGGEALLQKEAVLELSKIAKAHNLDVTLYTGSTLEELLSRNDEVINEVLHLIDYLIDGPFVLSLKDTTLPYRGSSNQRLIDVKKSLKENKVILFEPF